MLTKPNDQDATESTKRPRKRRRFVAVAIAVTVAIAGLVSTASPAGATLNNHRAECATYTGAFGRNVRMTLEQSKPGVTAAIYLYRWYGNTPVYQGQMDYSRVSAAGYWVGPSGYVGNQLSVTAPGPGLYSLAVHLWAYNTYVGGYWTTNGCNF